MKLDKLAIGSLILAFAFMTPVFALLPTHVYYYPVYVNETAGTNYSDGWLNITLDTATLIAAGELRGDCADLYLADSSDNLLNISIFNCDNANSIIASKLNFLEPNDVNREFRLWFGNTSVVPAFSNWTSIYPMWYDCNAVSSDWLYRGTVTYGSSYCTMEADNDEMIEKWNSTDGNWVAEARLMQTGTTASVYTQWGFQTWIPAFYVQWGRGVGFMLWGTGAFNVYSRSYSDSAQYQNDIIEIAPADYNDWHVWKFTYNSTDIAHYKDGVLYNNLDTYTPATNTTGVTFAAVGGSAQTFYVDWTKRWRLTASDPVYYLGAKVSLLDNITFGYTPASPHVEEVITLNATNQTNLVNLTDWWYDFDDGTSITHDSDGIIEHTFYFGGIYNVTVDIYDATGGVNYTVYTSVTVDEPTIEIWSQDAVSGSYIQNFTVVATNSTNSTDYTVVGYYGQWNYTSFPRGNVSILIEKSAYNHTAEYINVTNSSDVNFTASVNPAIIIIRPRDATYPQLVVPATVILYNITNTYSQTSNLDETLITDSVTCADECSNSSTSSEYYGQVFEYTLVASGTGTGAGDIIRSFLYIKDEGGSSQLIDWANKTAGSGTETINRILYVSRLGYEIRETDGTLVSSSTDILDEYPFRAYTTLQVSCNAGESSYATSLIKGATPEFEFYIPASATTGVTSIAVAQNLGSPFSFVDTTYLTQSVEFNISETSLLNYSIYLYETSQAVEQVVYVIDTNNNPIESAYVQTFGAINDSYVLISSGFTDGVGRTSLSLKDGTSYYFTASKSGFATESMTVAASSSAVYITLTQSITYFENPFEGITYSLDLDEPLETGDTYNVTMTISDSGATLINYSLGLWLMNVSQYQGVGTSASGGILFKSFTVPTNAIGYYIVDVDFYRTFSGDTYSFSRNYTYIVLSTGVLDDIKDDVASLDNLTKTIWTLILVSAGFLVSPFAGVLFLWICVIVELTHIGVALIGTIAIASIFAQGERL